MSTIKEIQHLKEEAKNLISQAEQAKWCIAKIKEEYGEVDLDQIKEEIARLKEEKKEKEKECDRLLEEYRNQYEKNIDGFTEED
jgi:hypothetical protein